MSFKARTRMITGHNEIRRWAEEHGAKPAWARVGERGRVGDIKLELAHSDVESLDPISWNEWFRHFEEERLALKVQNPRATWETSNFYRLVTREAAGVGAERSVPEPSRPAALTSAQRPESKNVRRSSDVRPAQKRRNITNITRQQEGAKPSPHTRPSGRRAA